MNGLREIEDRGLKEAMDKAKAEDLEKMEAIEHLSAFANIALRINSKSEYRNSCLPAGRNDQNLNTKQSRFSHWSLEPEIYLGFGFWNLGFKAYALYC